jgi:glucosylceramidase
MINTPSMKLFQTLSFYILSSLLIFSGCNTVNKSGQTENAANGIEFWLTKADSTVLLQKQPAKLLFNSEKNSFPFIDVDTTQSFQTIDGFGYSLTGGSATLINQLDPAEKKKILQELFGKGETDISISYLRISIGASDLDPSVFSYDDLLPGETDVDLTHFSLDRDRRDLIPVLKEILKINPQIKILGSPWSAPVWMKDNGKSMGGSLKPEYYDVYARYFVKYIQQMKSEGIAIDAITVQNEPLHPGNNPSMYMTAARQADLIKNHLGPAFRKAGLSSKIIIYDHNCNRPDYPLEILNDPGAKQFIDGSAFHLYEGDISALSQVHNAHPDKHVYFTEQWTGARDQFGGDLKWHLKNVIIGSMRNWSRVALEWNLASDQNYNPHTPGGCTECKGALTIGPNIKRNVSYYIVAHASKFVPPNSVRIASNVADDLYNVAFKTPEGRKILIVENDGSTDKKFNIRCNNKWSSVVLPKGGIGTYVW